MTTTIPEPSGPPAAELNPAQAAAQATPAVTQVWAVGALKGGTGKTRIAMLIALFLATVLGRRVVVFDADSASQTSSKWPDKARARGYQWPVEVIRHPFETLDEEIDKVRARGDVDHIIVDVGGGNIAAFLAALRRSNKLIVPLCPDEGDLEQAPQTREAALMAAARNTVGGCMMFFVLSRCEHSNDKVDARDTLLNDDQPDGAYPLLDVDIPLLVAYKRSYGRIPQMKVPADDRDCPRWKDLVGFVPLLIETGMVTKDEAIGAGVITRREAEAVVV
jgi:cellulose biosynthesis protein BcsQ